MEPLNITFSRYLEPLYLGDKMSHWLHPDQFIRAVPISNIAILESGIVVHSFFAWACKKEYNGA